MPVLSILLATLVFGGPAPLDRPVKDLDFQEEDFRVVLRSVFKKIGNPGYTIDPAVQGTASLKMTGAPLHQILNRILRPLGATFRLEAGIVQILKAEPPPVSGDATPSTPHDPPARISFGGDRERIDLLIAIQKTGRVYLRDESPAHERIVRLLREDGTVVVSEVQISPILPDYHPLLPRRKAAEKLAELADLKLEEREGRIVVRSREESAAPFDR